MEILKSFYDMIAGLGSFLLIPVFFFLIGLAAKIGFQRAGQCALAILGSTVAIQLLLNALSAQLVTLVDTMAETYSLSTGAANLHWDAAAAPKRPCSRRKRSGPWVWSGKQRAEGSNDMLETIRDFV